MKRAFAILAPLVIACPSLIADETVMPYDPASLMLPVRAVVAAFNSHVPNLPDNALADDAVILDRFPPFVWSGHGAAAAWLESLLGKTSGEQEKRRKLEEHIDIGKPLSPAVAGDRAYVIVPYTLAWRRLGKMAQRSGFCVVAERRGDDGTWRITGLSWAAGVEPPN